MVITLIIILVIHQSPLLTNINQYYWLITHENSQHFKDGKNPMVLRCQPVFCRRGDARLGSNPRYPPQVDHVGRPLGRDCDLLGSYGDDSHMLHAQM